MKTVIVGCGRVGAAVAEALDRAGHEVIIIDRLTSAFDKLETTFKGKAVRGDGTDEDVLLRAGAQDADLFLALTEGDNRNVMAAQLATEALGVTQVVAKVNDPLRAEAYAALGLATICRTDLMLDAILGFTGLGAGTIRGVQEATGHHPGDHGDGIPTNPDGTSVPVPTASTTMPSSGSTMPPGASPATAEPTPQTVTREA
ncbi:MAG: trk/ktr system potassium uptake protein [Chloroflexota bacterium]|jgi:trk system potassium uptake protein TrkA|nr:trk/ktr system potassium uptake protein [Chloroflexota bacterium]